MFESIRIVDDCRDHLRRSGCGMDHLPEISFRTAFHSYHKRYPYDLWGFHGVFIAIEIFQNIILYLRDDVIHVKIVLATALMAIARKVIILDYEDLEPMYVFATGVVLVATGIAYWFVHKLPSKSQSEPLEEQE